MAATESELIINPIIQSLVWALQIFVPFFGLGLVLQFIYIIIKAIPIFLQYRESKYKEESGNSLMKVLFDRGTRGEFLIFRELEKWGGHSKVISNVYVPREDGTTTEIDLVMINQYGIYVLESKNYGGKIYGNDKYKYWTQYFPYGKFRFYNPVWQNRLHVNALKNVLDPLDCETVHSLIVFGNRCEIKKAKITKKQVRLIQTKDVIKTLESDRTTLKKVYLTTNEINDRYKTLRKYALADELTKWTHVAHVQQKMKIKK